MFDPKHVADIVTLGRGLLAIGLVWLGLRQGADGLGLAVWLIQADWTGDVLDGFLARRSQTLSPTWPRFPREVIPGFLAGIWENRKG